MGKEVRQRVRVFFVRWIKVKIACGTDQFFQVLYPGLGFFSLLFAIVLK